MRDASWRVWLVMMAGAAGACTSGGNNAGTGGSGGTGGFECTTGASCTCADGSSGTTNCEFGPPVCECNSCPMLGIDLKEPASGCGGEPFGSWIARTAEVTAVPVEIYEGLTSDGTCAAQLLDVDPVVDMRLVLYDGGGANVSWSGVRVKQRFLESCVRNANGDTCEDLFCTRNCGLCDCDDVMLGASGSYTWTRTSTSLTLTQTSFPKDSTTFSYCVNGDSMTLEIPGLRVTLHRADFGGAPIACAARPLADCAKGSGCGVGECVGTAACATSTTEATCTNRQGCSWDTSRCSGTAAQLCTLAEYGSVPGCRVYQPGATCVGTPVACLDIPAAQCTGVPGCQVRDVCQGPALDCGQIALDHLVCDYDIGCTQGNSGCVGTSSCGAQPTQLRCKSRYDCVWTVGVCTGTPTTCASNTLTSCPRNPGCAVQGTPL